LHMRLNYRFQILAPPQTPFSASLGGAKISEQLYYQYLASMQSLRGRVYLKDGAVQPWELKEDGRFPMPADEQSWHFLLIDDEENTIGCARYLVHPNTVPLEMLRIYRAPIMRDPVWGDKVRKAVESDLHCARREDLAFVEIGGWALSEEWRGTR